jgi:hypothetical protein
LRARTLENICRSVRGPFQKLLEGLNMVSRPISELGKANDLCEETVNRNIDAIGLGDRALKERIIEITSGKSILSARISNNLQRSLIIA